MILIKLNVHMIQMIRKSLFNLLHDTWVYVPHHGSILWCLLNDMDHKIKMLSKKYISIVGNHQVILLI